MPIKFGTTGISSIFKGNTKIGRIYKGLTLVYQSSLLPAGYILLDYIENPDQNAYINTGIMPDDTTGFKVRMSVKNTTADLYYLGCREIMQTNSRFGLGVYDGHTYMAFGKEDVSLCGFTSGSELEMFKMLLKVSGIGPKGALNILSGVSVDTLKMAIASGDDKLIAASKGISAKTAQKIIVELKGKMSKELLSVGTDVRKAASKDDDRVNEAINAVVATGFDRTSCVRALANIQISDQMTVDEIIDLIFANITF